MLPSAGDILKVIVGFALPDGTIMQNIFYWTILSTTATDWDNTAADIATYLVEVYEQWMTNVATEVNSETLEIALRDETAGEWNQVYQAAFLSIGGTDTADSGSPTSSGTVVAFPEVVRHWGFKNFPPPSEGATTGGVLTGVALADLLITGVLWVLPFVEFYGGYQPGVYSLATETFRAFTGSIVGSTSQGTRVTRKTGRGI